MTVASRRQKIGHQVLKVVLPVVLVLAGVVLGYWHYLERKAGQIDLERNLADFTRSQAEVLNVSGIRPDPTRVAAVFGAWRELTAFHRAELLDQAGNVIAGTEPKALPRDASPIWAEAVVGGGEGGKLRLAFHDGALREKLQGNILAAGSLVLVAAAGLIVVLLLAVRSHVTRPLERLRLSLRENAESELRRPLSLEADNELGDVVVEYNRMLKDLDQHMLDIRHMSTHDVLTGLANRRLFEDRLEHAIGMAERHQRTVSVFLLDLDAFKAINDTLGHDTGDRLLTIVAERLRESVRAVDTVARWGGDEFAVIAENLGTPAEAAAIARKMISSISQPLPDCAEFGAIGVSIGISIFPGNGINAASLIKAADLALSEAKAAGRKDFRFFDTSMHDRLERALRLEKGLRRAIAADEFELHYQPKLSTAEGRLLGVEALIRWNHPDDGMIMPGEFIPVAEECGIIVDIGNWVVAEACRQIKRWRDEALGDIKVAVNLSPKHFHDKRAVQTIIEIVTEAGISPALIEIEMTEATFFKDPQQSIELLTTLREHGFSLAIDDFGTGYSSLSWLARLPVSTLKIDRSFVDGIDTKPHDAEIVRTIIALGQTMRLELVAEGVETEGEFAFLKESGCSVVQGFLFSRPIPAKALANWIADSNRAIRKAPFGDEPLALAQEAEAL